MLECLAVQGAPLELDKLCQLLDIAGGERELFERRIGAMQRDGQVMVNRRGQVCLPDKLALIKGRIEGHPDGFGFVIPDDGSADLFLSPREMHQVLHGDRVLARESGVDRRGRREGKIVEVLERANARIVGRYFVQHGVGFVVAENRRINQDILIPPEAVAGAQAGQVVMVEVVAPPSKNSEAVGRIIDVLGNYADPGMEIEIALRKHILPFEFSPQALGQTRKLPKTVRKIDYEGREDATSLPLVTIDGETAKDFDDAVYCERQGQNFRLVVAIADVSHYVETGSPLDGDAYERGNSVYFPRRVIPMLPEALSNGLCSLNPRVERLAMVCDMTVTRQGNIKSYRFYPAVMYSHARLTYNQVWDWLSGAAAPDAGHAALHPYQALPETGDAAGKFLPVGFRAPGPWHGHDAAEAQQPCHLMPAG